MHHLDLELVLDHEVVLGLVHHHELVLEHHVLREHHWIRLDQQWDDLVQQWGHFVLELARLVEGS